MAGVNDGKFWVVDEEVDDGEAALPPPLTEEEDAFVWGNRLLNWVRTLDCDAEFDVELDRAAANAAIDDAVAATLALLLVFIAGRTLLLLLCGAAMTEGEEEFVLNWGWLLDEGDEDDDDDEEVTGFFSVPLFSFSFKLLFNR